MIGFFYWAVAFMVATNLHEDGNGWSNSIFIGLIWPLIVCANIAEWVCDS